MPEPLTDKELAELRRMRDDGELAGYNDQLAMLATIDSLTARLATAEAEVARLREALERIAAPMPFDMNVSAYAVVADIARAALDTYRVTKEGSQ